MDITKLNAKGFLPPYKYVKHNWKRKLIRWQEKNVANQKATNPNVRNDISSRFVLQETDDNYETLHARNQLGDFDGLDESLFLYDTGKNCPNMKNRNTFANYKSQDAKYSGIAKLFSDEVAKMNGGKLPLEIEGKKFYFYGENYDYDNLDALSKLCLYDWEIKRGQENLRKCNANLIHYSKMIQKYHVYGRCKFFLAKTL